MAEHGEREGGAWSAGVISSKWRGGLPFCLGSDVVVEKKDCEGYDILDRN